MAKYKVNLDTVGNPDHGENPFRPLGGVESRVVDVDSIEEAQRVVRQYIEENDLGGGNWAGGKVWRTEDNVCVGEISYNGRFWEGGYHGR